MAPVFPDTPEESSSVHTWCSCGSYGEKGSERCSFNLRTRALLLNNITELGDAVKSVIAVNVEVAKQHLSYERDNTAKLREAVYVAACEEWDTICGSFMAMLDMAVTS